MDFKFPAYIQVMFPPHVCQHYDTAGNYGENETGWWVAISKMEDPRAVAAVLIHEIVEMFLTKFNGVDWKEIDDFDRFGLGKDHPDPGTMPEAPYHKEHMIATAIEYKFLRAMGMSTEEYDSQLNSLEYK